jgi:hypothetical protein
MREGAHRMVSAVVRCLASDWESSMRSISRATPPAVLPGWRTRATASALNSEVNHRRRRRFLPATTRHTQWPLRGSGGDLQGLPLRLAEGICACQAGGLLLLHATHKPIPKLRTARWDARTTGPSSAGRSLAGQPRSCRLTGTPIALNGRVRGHAATQVGALGGVAGSAARLRSPTPTPEVPPRRSIRRRPRPHRCRAAGPLRTPSLPSCGPSPRRRRER